MKKLAALCVAGAVALAQCMLLAAPVSEETAEAAASAFLAKSAAAQRILPGRAVSSLEAYGGVWIAHLAPSGYIELAGSTKCTPVLSFSEYDFTEPEPGSPLAAKLLADGEWCNAMEADASASDNPQWQTFAAPAPSPSRRLLGAPTADTSSPYVAPFLGASWYQDAPYNDLSPLTSLSGCMATAAGQEHRYWRWPYRYEKWRSTTHGLRNSLNEYSDHKFRLNGLVPFNYDKIWGSYSAPTKTTPTAADKEATYNAAFLSLWMQSLTGMGYKPGGSGGTIKLCTNAEDYWFEKGPVMNYWRDGYTNLWTAVTNDLANGSPIQVNSPGHQMVVDGYAVDDAGTENEVDWININYGWGSPGGWNNFQTAVLETTPGGRLADFQIGYRPQKIVQFEPVPKVCRSDVTLTWHIAPCYTNRMTGFTLDISGGTGSSSSVDIPTHDETTSYTATGLESGYEYTFTVTPVMADGSEARSNSATTTIGTPAAAPEISAVSSVAGGLELVQQGFYIECGRGIVNDIAVTCSESTTSLDAYPSHITVLPDEDVSVTKSGNVFTVHLDATDMDSQWNGEMLILTLVAKNSDGTEAYKNLMLRFNGMRQVLDGTFDVVETNPTTPVWYCGTTTLDAKGQNITFGANAFQGNGCNVTLTDSVGGGSFTFAGLDGFLGTLHITSAVDVNLPNDMSGFRGTLAYDRCYNDNEFHYTLSRDLPATATVYLPQYTMLYLDNVTVDAAITGSGDVYIVTGNSTLNNTSGFSGTVAIGDFDNSGSLTLNAGEEPGVSIWNGTLYLTLSKAQVAYGYSTTQIKDLESFTGSKVIFLDEAGTELARWTSDQTTYSIASTANTWTPNELGTGSFWDASRWSQGLPSEGDYVIFNDSFGDSQMTLNLSSDFNLGYVKVIGTKFNIESSGTGILSVDTFENETYTKISTANFQPGAVIPEAKLFVAEGITIDCEIDQSLAKNMRDISDTMYALDWEDCWHGTVVFKDYTAAGLNPWEWGNSNSVVRLNGVTGYFAYNKDFYGPVELVDNGSTVALHWNNGSGSSTNKFHKLTGTGTFKTSGSGGGGEKVLVKDASEFTGSLQLASKTLAFGPEMPSSNTGSNGKLHVCTNATIAAGAIWNIGGGVYLGGGCDLDIYGQLWSTSTAITTYADNAVVTLEDNAVLKVGHALAGFYAPTLNFKAGTYQIGTNVRETKTVNFCAASGKGTTLDANGHKLTLGPAFFSGSGDVYLTSSASGGSVVIEGIPAAYTGTIYADISCPVTLSGPQRGGMLNISDIVVSTSSANIGTITVGSGATLSLAVSRDEESAGYTTSGITLVDGGELEFRSSSGTTLAVATEADAVNGNYTLEGDSEVSLDPLLRYEFNGNMVSTGTDNDATLRIYSGTASYYEDEQLYTKSVPYINKDFAMPDDDWTLTMRCVMPANNSEKATIAIMFGKSGGNQFGLVSGTAENTVALATKTGLIGEAVEVENATSELHMYTIVKTSGNVKLYVDGVLKVDSDTTVSGLTKRFQIGSVFQGNSSSHAACTDSTSRIDFMMFHDFAASASFVASLAAPYLPDPEELSEGAVASVVYNGQVVYYDTVVAALTAVYMGQSDTLVVKVYDGSTTDYSGLGFTYDAATQTYTMASVVAKIHTGIIETEFATLAEACDTAVEEGVSVVILLKAFAEIGESVPAGWVYVTPAESNTDYGTLALAVNEIPNTVCKMSLTQQNVTLSGDGEWAVVGASPIYVTLGTATNAFTLSFDADIPEGFGTLLSWDSVLDSTTVDSRVVMTNDASKQVIWRKGDGTLSTVGYTASELIPSGEHYIELEWVHNSGGTIKVDGTTYYSSSDLKFTNYFTSKIAFGGSALGGPDDVLTGLKVKNLNIRFGKTPTEPDEEAANYPIYDYVTRLDGTIYHGNDDNRAVITNWQSQLIHPATRPVPAGKTDAEFDTIDVLFVYDTPGKASVESGETEEWNGFSKLEVFSAKATARMNQILCTTDMDTNFWFRMVGVHCVDGTGGTIAEILGKGELLKGEYSGLLDLRDRYGADVIVTPTTQSGGYGGLARLNTLDEITSRHQNAAYHIASVLLGYSQTHAWVHEIGHNMSLNHYPPANFDPANTWRGLGIQHKIAVDGTSMSTVMAAQGYADFCGGFSSKNHIYHGSMLSLSNHLDSTGVLLEAAPYVSEWRTTRIPEMRSVKCSVTYGSYLTGDTAFELSYPDPDAEIHYKVWGENNNEYQTYNGPFTVTADGKNYAYIEAYVITNGAQSAAVNVAYNPFNSEMDALLGSPKLPWTTTASIDGGWAAASGEEYLEVADSFTGSRTSECTLTTTVVGPDTLSFEHSELLKDNPYWHDTYPHSYPNSSFVVWVDNEPVYALRDATNTLSGWVSTDIAIPEGTHKVEFIYTHRSGYVSGETVRIKNVSLASAVPEYTGPAPTAVWVAGEFGDHKSAHAGYQISLNGNTTNALGQIVIGSTTTLGATIAVPEDKGKQVTMLVKYSIPSGSHADNSVAAAMYIKNSYELGALADSGESALKGYWLDTRNNGLTVTDGDFAFSSPAPSVPQSGYILVSNWSQLPNTGGHGTAVYTGETIASLSGGEKTGLRFTGDNNCITNVSIGGPTKAGAVPWAGMVIEGVAVFDSWVTPDDIAGYKFPEQGAVQPVDDDEYLVEPAAVWVNDFKTAEKNGYTLSVSGTTEVLDDTFGGTLTIGDAAAVIDVNAADSKALTVLVKYSDAPAVSADTSVMAFGAQGGVGFDVGGYLKSAGTFGVYRNYQYNNASYNATHDLTGTTLGLESTGGYLLCARTDNDFQVYVGDALDNMTGYSSAKTSDITFANVKIKEVGIGGKTSYPAIASGLSTYTGFVVEKIVVFSGYYTPRQLLVPTYPEDAATLEIGANATWNFAAGTTRTYESIGALSASGTIAVTNETLAVGVYKLAEWTTAQKKSTGYGHVGTLSTPGLGDGLTAELVYGANAIYLRVYNETAQFLKPTLKVWPYGDSITEGFNAGGTRANYRVLLGQKLSMLGYNVEMVGCYDKINGADAIDPSGQTIPDAWKWHSAKHGATAGPTTSAAGRANLCENVDTLCAQAGNPDVVLLLAGANDIVPATGLSAQQVVSSITNIVEHLAMNLPNAKIVVGNQLNVESGYTSYNYDHVTNMIPQVNALLMSYTDDLPDGLSGRVFLADLNSYVKSGEYGILFDQSGDHLHPDWWGHDQMAEGWLSVITNVYTTANGPFPSNNPPTPVADGALGAAVKEELAAYREGFTLARTIDVASTNTPTAVNGEGVTENIGKVGYFVEYVRGDNEAHKWVWVDMDAFGSTIDEMGLPTANHQCVVSALHVKSNHAGIEDVAADDDTVTGFIEFSPYNYTGNASGVTGAPAGNGTCCDWNDTLSESGTYGCMQVHRIFSPEKSAADGVARGGQVLFAYNNWLSDSTAAEFGIGNFSSHFYRGASDAQTLDYTYTANATKMNAAAYRVKRIEIWTKEASGEGRTVYYKSGYWGTGGDTTLAVTLADGTTTTLRDGDTIVIDSKSSNDIYFGPLPDYANKIRVSRNVVFSSGIDNASILDGATIEIDEGKTVTFKCQYHDIELGTVEISGLGSVAFDVNGRSLDLNPNATVNGVAVRPALDEEAEMPFAVIGSDGKAVLKVKPIPGLWYSVLYGSDPTALDATTEAVQATQAPLVLEAPMDDDAPLRFYRIRVAPQK